MYEPCTDHFDQPSMSSGPIMTALVRSPRYIVSPPSDATRHISRDTEIQLHPVPRFALNPVGYILQLSGAAAIYFSGFVLYTCCPLYFDVAQSVV